VTDALAGGPIGRSLRQFRGFEPDARRFLLVTLASGAALSLYWIDFNLYLSAIGLSASGIGVIATLASVASAVASFPASSWSDRVGRRLVMVGGGVTALVGVVGLIVVTEPPAIALCAALFAVGTQAVNVVATPYMTEHSRPEHRSELFAVQFAIGSATNIVAAALGGVVAGALAGALGLAAGGPGVYRVVLVFMAVLLVVGIAIMLRLRDDRPAVIRARGAVAAGEPARFPAMRAGWSVGRFGITVRDRRAFGRLVLPGFLIAIGAGQVIPFLNLFVQQKFGLNLASLNGVFAITSVGTMLAVLYQPTLARRFGRLRSVLIVQGASIPFLVVLGFSPLLWTVIAAMAVRNSLMNAGNPIFNAFAMDQVSRGERATLAAAMSSLWSLGWVIAGTYYSLVHAVLGFDAGYALNFATIVALYSTATFLYWRWFGRSEPRPDSQHPPAIDPEERVVA
jgi:MFS family permease